MSNLLCMLEQPEYSHHLACFRRVSVAKGSFVDGGDDVAMLTSGQARAYLANCGQELMVFDVERGHPVFTNSGLVLRARQNCELLVAPRTGFLKAVASSPELSWPLFVWNEHLLNRSLRIIEGIRFLDVRTRLIRYIVSQCVERGQPMLDGIAFRFEDTIEDVANEIGTSRQSASQVLNHLIRERYIVRPNRTQIVVRNLDDLKNMRKLDAQSGCQS